MDFKTNFHIGSVVYGMWKGNIFCSSVRAINVFIEEDYNTIKQTIKYGVKLSKVDANLTSLNYIEQEKLFNSVEDLINSIKPIEC